MVGVRPFDLRTVDGNEKHLVIIGSFGALLVRSESLKIRMTGMLIYKLRTRDF